MHCVSLHQWQSPLVWSLPWILTLSDTGIRKPEPALFVFYGDARGTQSAPEPPPPAYHIFSRRATAPLCVFGSLRAYPGTHPIDGINRIPVLVEQIMEAVHTANGYTLDGSDAQVAIVMLNSV